ncbi:MAG: sulfite exporter TauE/SafE family protein, partial [Bifidobacteriaceae bacterium]|nr:sulfite exporter TauE/SafE family protein [Bifidobacteriaceae bacterium]
MADKTGAPTTLTARPAQPSQTQTVIPISGMTCKACEARVAKALRKVDGVERAKVSLAKAEAVVVSRGPLPPERLAAAVGDAGYRVGRTTAPLVSADKAVWRDAALAAAAMALILWGASNLGMSDLTGRLGSPGTALGGALALVFALGVVASVSTCMALVGGLVLSLSAQYAQARPSRTAGGGLRPQLMFNLGRVVGFGALGAGLGALGGAFQVNVHLLALAMIAVAVVMGLLGLKMTELSPRLSRFSVTLPAALGGLVQRGERSRGHRDGAAAVLGAASFFLPCGFTQAVQVYALASGDPLRSGLIMAVFALGTAPGLVGVGALGTLGRLRRAGTASAGAAAGGRRQPPSPPGPPKDDAVQGAPSRLFRFVGVAVCAFALVNLLGAAQILRPGWFAGQPAELAATRSDNVTDDGAQQVLRTVQDGAGYTPEVATVYVDRPVRWEVDSQGLACTSSMSLEAMGLGTVDLKPGLNVF